MVNPLDIALVFLLVAVAGLVVRYCMRQSR